MTEAERAGKAGRTTQAGRSTTRRAIVIDGRDNVATAVDHLAAGETMETVADGLCSTVVLRTDIPFGHKYALEPIPAGGPVIKYGEIIGVASAAISPGEHVHVHNVEGVKGRGDKAAAEATSAGASS